MLKKIKASVKIKTERVYSEADYPLPSIILHIRSDVKSIGYNYARNVKKNYREKVHVITGNLRDSCVVVKKENGGHKVVVGMYYGVYEEFGTRYRPPHPAFRPAIEKSKKEFRREFGAVFKRTPR